MERRRTNNPGVGARARARARARPRAGGRVRLRSAALVGLLAAGGLAACATPSGQPQADPTQLDFPTVAVGEQDSLDLVVTNVAQQGALTIESVALAGPDADQFADEFDDDGNVVVQPGQATSFRVRYSPTEAGAHEASLRMNHSGAETLVVPLSGTGTAPDPGARPLTAAPASVAFPAATVGQTAHASVTLTNSAAPGAGSLELASTQITGSGAALFSDDFTDGTPVTLAPGASRTVDLTFAPTAAGSRSAQLVVQHSGTNAPLTVPLSGTATVAGSPTVLYRVNSGGPAVAGGAGTPAWAEDSTAAPSPYANAAATGNAVAATATPMQPADGSVPAGTPPALFQTERSDGAAAAPNLAYSFPVPEGTPVEVRLYLAEIIPAAQSVGARVFDVRIDGAVAARDVDVFARVGANRGMVLSAPAVSDGTVDVELAPGAGNPSVKAVEIVAGSGQVPPWLAASPATPTFTQAKLRQTSTQDVVLTNVGTSGSLTITGTSVSGPDAKMFADRFDDAAPVTLGPGQSTTVPVVVLPTTTGTRRANLAVTHSAGDTPLVVPLSAPVTVPTASTAPSFGKSLLAGAVTGAPTSLQFGPDGRLYVALMDGTVRVFTVERRGDDDYAVTATETITAVRTMTNRNDDGTPNPSVTGRLVTGLLVRGTPATPVLYVVSSDPRIGAGTEGGDLNLDTNSGVLSRLTRNGPPGNPWTKVDLVRGLPRSEENHTGNGLALLPATNTLLIAYGGNTNKGAPAHNFAELPEYALSAAVLSVDLTAIGNTTYDLPTLDDETRPGATDANDPFGGDDGRNQARLVAGGPVQVHAPGFRNPYDLVVTEAGRLYTIDNGGNAGWGGAPQPDSTAGTCTNGVVEASDSDLDSLVHITGPGFYGGHANPTRANAANTFNPTNPQSPVGAAQARPGECDYRTEAERGALASFPFSTNGLDEYTATSFGGSLRGDLITASQGNAIHRVELDAAGTAVTSSTTLFSSVGEMPLDVVAQGDGEPFPGTIWVADFLGDDIVVFEPDTFACSGADDPALDEDGDGYDNADEIDNATNPCSSADVPPDADGDDTSDLNDADDDNDGAPDTTDRFALDPADGRDTNLPVVLTWDNDAPPAGGILGLGFTGLMANGSSNYASLFDPTKMTAGGAAGVVTLDEIGDGDAFGGANTQREGFQLGLDVTGASAPFVVHTRLPAPFSSVTPEGGQSYGVFFGTGSQDDYVKVTVAANGGAGGFLVVDEQGGVPTSLVAPGPVWPSTSTVDLFLRVDPAARTVQPRYAVDGGAPVDIGSPRTVPASWFSGAAGPAAGLVSTSSGPAPSFPGTWDFLEVRAG